MKVLCGLILGLLTTLNSHAAEIVAWRVPLSYYGIGGLEAPGVVRCKDAPEASPFFKPGDELGDLTKTVPDRLGNRKIALDWLVWNASSRKLEAKGNWWDLSIVYKILDLAGQPVQCRVITSVFEVPADGAPLSEASKSISEASVVFRSAQKSKAFWKDGGKSIRLDVEGTIGDGRGVADVLFKAKVGVPGQLPLKVETSFSCEDGKTLWIARDFDGKKGLDLRVAATVELLDGSPFRERMMIQKGDAESPVFSKRRESSLQAVGEEGWFVSVNLDPSSLGAFLMPEGGEPEAGGPGGDPFEERTPDESSDLPHADSQQPPEFLRERITHEILNAHEWIANIIPDLPGESYFAGYDPIEERIYFFSPNRTSADMVYAEFSSLHCGGVTVVSTLEGLGQTRLIGRSGSKSTLARILDAKTNTRLLEIEPTIGESDDVVDFRYNFENRPDSQHVTRISSSAVMEAGIPNVLFSYGGGNEPKAAASMEIEISRIGE